MVWAAWLVSACVETGLRFRATIMFKSRLFHLFHLPAWERGCDVGRSCFVSTMSSCFMIFTINSLKALMSASTTGSRSNVKPTLPSLIILPTLPSLVHPHTLLPYDFTMNSLKALMSASTMGSRSSVAPIHPSLMILPTLSSLMILPTLPSLVHPHPLLPYDIYHELVEGTCVCVHHGQQVQCCTHPPLPHDSPHPLLPHDSPHPSFPCLPSPYPPLWYLPWTRWRHLCLRPPWAAGPASPDATAGSAHASWSPALQISCFRKSSSPP